MKIDLKAILIIALMGFIVWQNFIVESEIVEPDPIVITVPEKTGRVVDTIEVVEKDTVYLKGDERIIEVDAGWKDKYNNAIDSLEKQKLFYESIKIREYEKTLVDNDTLLIKGFAKTRGSLLSYSVDYKIKSFDFSYVPEVVTKRPDLSMGAAMEVGLPAGPMSDFRVKGSVYFENSNGGGFSIGADTKETVWLGLRKTFKLKD